jgi:hypothetical protein
MLATPPIAKIPTVEFPTADASLFAYDETATPQAVLVSLE